MCNVPRGNLLYSFFAKCFLIICHLIICFVIVCFFKFVLARQVSLTSLLPRGNLLLSCVRSAQKNAQNLLKTAPSQYVPICSYVHTCVLASAPKNCQKLVGKKWRRTLKSAPQMKGRVGWGWGPIERVTRLIFLVEINAKTSLFGVKIGGKPCCD